MSSSNDQPPTRILHELRHFISSLCVPAPRQRGIFPKPTFGHIQLPPYRLANPNLMKEICDAIPPMDDARHLQPLFVLPDAGMGILDRGTGDKLTRHPLSPEIMAFSDLLIALRASRKEAGSSLQAWKGSDDPRTWHQSGIMPRRAFVVIHLDSQVSADSALAQIALVQWAFDVAIDTQYCIRILTMSTEGVRNVVPDLAKLRSPDIAIPELNLIALGVSMFK
ncbi:hypothetical protein CDV31_006279, partial [Fusarium ambrosium]